MLIERKRSKQLLWGGLSLITGFPFLAAGISSTLLNGKLRKGLSITAAILFVIWYLAGFQGAAIAAISTAVIAISVRSGYSLLKTLFLTSGLTLIAGALLSLGFPGYMNIGESDLEPLREVYISAGLESATIDQVFSLITYYSPGIGAAHIVLGCIVSVLFFKSLSGNDKKQKIHETAFFRMHWGLAWIPISCLIAIVIARSNPLPESLLRIAKNILVFSILPYGLEGLQVAVKWAKGVPGMVFILIMSTLFVPPFILGGLVLLGILDTWFDYRKKIDKRIERMKNEGSSDQIS